MAVKFPGFKRNFFTDAPGASSRRSHVVEIMVTPVAVAVGQEGRQTDPWGWFLFPDTPAPHVLVP